METNFLPEGTRFLVDGDQPLGLVQELIVQWHSSGCYWLGLQLLLVDRGRLPGHVSEALIRQRLVTHDCRMEVLLAGDRPLNMTVLQYTRHAVVPGLDDVFLASLQTRPIRFTRPLKELDITFMRCSRCGHYDRCLCFDAQATEHGWAPAAAMRTAQRACPRCGHSGRQELDFHDEKLLKKLYMTPTTSHLVFRRHPDDSFPAAGETETDLSIVPAGFCVNNRPAWLAAACRDAPVAQILPKPSFLNDVFLASFGRMFSPVC